MLSLNERFWSKVNKKSLDECWEWQGYARSKDYGRLRVNGKYTLAHRISWVIHFGKIPDGLCVLHKCDNRKCINPNHLFLGTYSDNNQDMWNKNRHPIENMDRPSATMLGEKNTKSILCESDVMRIRKLHEDGMKQSEIAEMFAVDRPAIWKIVHRKTWKHV